MTDNFEYSFDEKAGGIIIKKYTGTSDAVVIPSEIDGYPVVSIGYGAFSCCFVTTITIPDSVTSIRDNAFNDIMNEDNSFVGGGLGLNVTYKGKSYIRERYENEDDQYYRYDFPKEFYAALWNGIKHEYCDECSYFACRINYDTGVILYFHDCFRVKKNVYGYKNITVSTDTPLRDISVPDWCPLIS